MSVEISPLRDDEREAARAVVNHWIETSTANFHEAPLTLDDFVAEVVDHPDPRHGCFAIREGGRFAGYVVISSFKGRCAYRGTAEVTVYVSPEHIGRGLGRTAVDFAVSHAEEAGLHVLVAVVSAENEASLRLFTSAGFVEAGRLREVGRKFGRLLDVVYLQRTLD